MNSSHYRFQYFALWSIAFIENVKCLWMESRNFKRKKFFPSCIFPRFPNFSYDAGYVGVFDGQTVSVFDKEAIYKIYAQGNFGKGSLSKSAPASFDEDDAPPIMMEQQWQNQSKWKTDCETQIMSKNSKYYHSTIFVSSVQNLLNFAFSNNTRNPWKDQEAENVIKWGNVKNVNSEGSLSPLNNSDSSSDPVKNMVEEILQTGKIKVPISSEINNIQPVLVIENIENCLMTDKFKLSDFEVTLKKNFLWRKEYLKLSLQEAFFLFFALGCLKILNRNGVEINKEQLWRNFCGTEKNFISKYICYHHFRSYGWTVRSGLKFGGDYLLYKIGPNYYHANYLVWISGMKKKKLSWNEFMALNRLMETCNKDLLLCEIFGPETEEGSSPDLLKEFSILELMTKRWIPSQERE